ncbi:hypothetical protein QMK19_03290 [Streptomyces sp. H10-C2]|uniref:hypothetical protein n=1 Tax=unclassified Streptomyces TaxID=2593676 RepID=UPI0024B9AE3F|nr:MULTISPECIES: hypothetical protein [unclassified Streptomyces]MDJ0342210.1 hypothetical protein [Streptomyces sp. PH10-H1]MDJ0368724.1 hypothetical protein [Streptomyces sp. H10-C2]
MAKHMNVGRSWRTPAKHDLLGSMLGQEVGAAAKIADARALSWIDLTAGDAARIDGLDWASACSPGILARHATKSTKPVEIDLYEIQAATYDRLLTNLAVHLPELGYSQVAETRWEIGTRVALRTHNSSGRTASIDHITRNHAVFVVNDPNAITEWAMRPTFAAEIAQTTWLFRTFSTMGCNVAGIKRLPIGERIDWFDTVESQQAALPAHRDLLLASISRDEAQWAYLIGTARKWRTTTEKVAETAFRKIGKGTALSWFLDDADAFQEEKLRLFLQKPERQKLVGREAEWIAAGRAERLAMLPPPEQAPDGPDDDPDDWGLFGIEDAA